MRFIVLIFTLHSAWCVAQTTATIRIDLEEQTVLADMRVVDGSEIELWRTTDSAGRRREWKTRLHYSNSKMIDRLYVIHNRLFAVLHSTNDQAGLELEEIKVTLKRSMIRKVTGVIAGLVGATASAPGLIAVYALVANDERFIPFLKLVWPVYHVVGSPISLFSTVTCAGLLAVRPPLRPVSIKPNFPITTVLENSAGGVDDIIYRDQNGVDQSLNASAPRLLL